MVELSFELWVQLGVYLIGYVLILEAKDRSVDGIVKKHCSIEVMV